MKYKKYSRPFTVAFQKHTYQQIKKISESMQLSMADILREIAEKALSEVKLENDVDHFIK
jgi:hypothetical protein